MMFIVSNAASELNNDIIAEDKILAEQLGYREKFRDQINNIAINYHYGTLGTEIASLICFDYQENGLKNHTLRRNCTITKFDLQISPGHWKLPKYNANNSNDLTKNKGKICGMVYIPREESCISSCKFSFNFSNYDAKESKITFSFHSHIVVTTLLKSKKDEQVFIDLTFTPFRHSDPKTGECRCLLRYRFKVAKSMWNSNRSVIVLFENNGWYSNVFEVVYESPEGNKILRRQFFVCNEIVTSKIFSQYTWREFQPVFFDLHNFLVFSKNNFSLTDYNINEFSSLDNYNKLVIKWKLNSQNVSLREPQDVEFPSRLKNLVCLTSYKERKSELIFLDSNYNIEKNMMIDLKPKVNKVLVNMYRENLGNINLFQSQCDEKTGDCKILRQQVDLENNFISKVEVIVNINSTDCILKDIFLMTARFLKGCHDNIILYICEKQVPFPLTNGFHYLILRGIYYLEPLKNQEIISINLTSLNYHEEMYKKFLDKVKINEMLNGAV